MEMTATKLFKDTSELIHENVLRMKYGVVYYPESGKLERAGIYVTGECQIQVHHMTHDAEVVSTHQLEDYGKKLMLFKDRYDIYPFWKVRYLDEEKVYQVLKIKTGELFNAMLCTIRNGEGIKICMFNEDKVTLIGSFHVKDYEKEYAVISK